MQKLVLFKSIILVVLTTVMLSCNDDESKTCTLLSTDAVWEGESYHSVFTYDNDKVIKQTSNYTGPSTQTVEVDYIYNSDERIDEVKVGTKKTKYTYNSTGDIVLSEVYDATTLTGRREYEYANGRIIKTQFYKPSDGSFVKANYYVFEYLNASGRGASKITHFNEDRTIDYVTEYEYDNRKVKLPHGMEAVYKLTLRDGNGLEHNVIRRTDTFSNYVSITTYDYEFNSDGYLIRTIDTSVTGSNTPSTMTVTQNYKCN
jgi:hypothetical protein